MIILTYIKESIPKIAFDINYVIFYKHSNRSKMV